MADEPTAEFEKQARELLRAQQETFVAAVRAWRESLAAGGIDPVPPPTWPQPHAPVIPTPVEMAEAYYAFAAKLLADQSRFMEALSQAMSAPPKKS